jgi:uncharacterized 2Fe-2S/4Fe-4S cluster protein (DUF4445 family)
VILRKENEPEIWMPPTAVKRRGRPKTLLKLICCRCGVPIPALLSGRRYCKKCRVKASRGDPEKFRARQQKYIEARTKTPRKTRIRQAIEMLENGDVSAALALLKTVAA